jgi:pimeloyl-ACP methyl ester carboxylesterase
VFKIPRPVTRFAFCNGMTPEQRRLTMSKLRAESPRIPGEPVNRSDLPDAVPRTWILTTRDRALSQKSQRASIAALGGVEVVIPMDACHELMFSHPEQLAKILVERCRFRQRGPS